MMMQKALQMRILTILIMIGGDGDGDYGGGCSGDCINGVSNPIGRGFLNVPILFLNVPTFISY